MDFKWSSPIWIHEQLPAHLWMMLQTCLWNMVCLKKRNCDSKFCWSRTIHANRILYNSCTALLIFAPQCGLVHADISLNKQGKRGLGLHGIKPVRLNGSFDSKCTRPETSHSYQSFTILINTFTGIIVYWHNLRFKWHNYSRHQTVK